MKLSLRHVPHAVLLATALLTLPTLGCSLFSAKGSSDISFDGDGGTPTGNPTPVPPHALGMILLGEAHAPSGGTSTPMVAAGFIPDAAAQKKCSTTVAGCQVTQAPKCGGVNGGSGCGFDETCTLDDQCNATCKKACTAQCGSDEECYFASPGSPACRKTETFTAGALAFAGTTTPITLFPPYSYSPTGTGSPFLAGASIEVQGSGATGAGFDKFDEKFTATTFLQTTPPLDKLSRTMVFGSGPLTVGWAPGQDTVIITAGGANGVAVCQADDTLGTFDFPREAIHAVMGSAGSSALSLSVSRTRKEVKTGEHTKGSMTSATVQAVGWLELTTMSTESASFQGCVANETMCSDGCFDTSYDPMHCGSCTNACGTGQTCSLGVCSGGSTSSCDSCAQAAQSSNGACAFPVSVCQSDPNCTNLTSCIAGCAGSTSCVQSCSSTYSAGISNYNAVINCICNTACPTTCATQCGH